jgi:hypothetical protein
MGKRAVCTHSPRSRNLLKGPRPISRLIPRRRSQTPWERHSPESRGASRHADPAIHRWAMIDDYRGVAHKESLRLMAVKREVQLLSSCIYGEGRMDNAASPPCTCARARASANAMPRMHSQIQLQFIQGLEVVGSASCTRRAIGHPS